MHNVVLPNVLIRSWSLDEILNVSIKVTFLLYCYLNEYHATYKKKA